MTVASGELRTDPAVTRIEPVSGWAQLRLRELWAYRELLYFFVWREIKVRYKQTLLGGAWAILQPVSAMIVFSVFFGRLAGVPSGGLPYPVTTFCALLPWQLFATAMSEASNSVVTNQRVIAKVFFPRLLVPLASVLVGVVDFCLAFVVLLLLMAWYGLVPGVAALTVPLWVVLATLTALGPGLWLAALNVRYRDVRYTVPFMTQLWLFATPVAYQTSLVPEEWRTLYALNPMVGVVDACRWALLGQGAFPASTLLVSGVFAAVVLVSGLVFFSRTERTFADLV